MPRQKTRAALREREDRYRDLFEHAEDIILSCTLDGTITSVNRVTERLLGWPREALIGQPSSKIFTPASVALGRERVRRSLTGEKLPKLFEIEMVRCDGSVMPCEGWARFIHDSAGRPIEHQGIYRDITERKRTTEALQASEERYRSLFENSNDAMLTLALDGRFTRVNRAFEALLGWSREELLGQHYRLVATPASLAQWDERTRRALAGERLPRIFETEARRKDGSVVPIECRTRFLRDTEGKSVGIEGTYRDITERKQQEIAERQRAEETLRKSEEHYRILFEESRDAIYITSREGTILEVNQAYIDLFGHTRAEMIDFEVLQNYVNPEDRYRFQQEIERQGAVRDFELKLRKKEGTVIDCLMSATVRRAPDGSILGYQGIIHDITERKRTEQLLADYSRTLERQVEERTQALQAKNSQLEDTLRQLQDTQNQLVMQQKLASLGVLTAGIAHEIRNPLNFVNNFADLSMEFIQELRDILARHAPLFDADTCADIEDILYSLDQNVQKITEHGKRADRIVNGMLQHSRGQAGVREPTDLNALLAEYVNLAYHGMRAQDASFNVSIETAYDPSLGLAEVVPQDIGRVFLNVLNNACYAVHVKHKELGGGFRPTLSVRTTNLGDRVEIRIRDNGNGIPPEVRETVFQPFFTTKPAGAGTGLGLSISYDIVVQEHKGALTVDTQVGQYAEFIITLPKQAT